MELTIDTVASPGAFLGHFSYVLLILSMLMTSMRWLRIIAVAAGITSASYSGFVLNDPVSTFWESMFTLVNLVQLLILWLKNRRARFSEEELLFCSSVLPDVEPGHARSLLKLGQWREAQPGTVLTTQGEIVTELVFITSGTVEVDVDQHAVASVGAGGLIGEISTATGQPATATVFAVTPIRYLGFEVSAFRKILQQNAELRHAFDLGLRANFRDKIIRNNQAAVDARKSSASVEDA